MTCALFFMFVNLLFFSFVFFGLLIFNDLMSDIVVLPLDILSERCGECKCAGGGWGKKIPIQGPIGIL